MWISSETATKDGYRGDGGSQQTDTLVRAIQMQILTLVKLYRESLLPAQLSQALLKVISLKTVKLQK